MGSGRKKAEGVDEAAKARWSWASWASEGRRGREGDDIEVESLLWLFSGERSSCCCSELAEDEGVV